MLLSACQTLPVTQHPSIHLGIEIRSVASGKVIYSQNADQPFIPASTVKLLTIATALAKLGPSYRFRTDVFYDGNLYLKGSGDPSFSLHDLDNLAAQIKQLAPGPIQDLVLDSSVFDQDLYGQDWLPEDFSFAYSAPVSGINLNLNRLILTFLPNGKILLDPLAFFIQLEQKGRRFKLKGPGIEIEDTLPIENQIRYKSYAIKNPEKWALALFQESLKRFGIQVKGKLRIGFVPSGLSTLTDHHSPLLSQMLINYTKFSNNLAHEALLKTLGHGSFQKGLEIVRTFTRIQGIVDGSGLSRSNRVTPTEMTQFLLREAQNFQISPELMASLPIAGKDGTLKSRLIGNAATNHLRAKTGTMKGVRALAGYFLSQSGNLCAFSAFTNHLHPNAFDRHIDSLLKNL